jgi:hypothetical protein
MPHSVDYTPAADSTSVTPRTISDRTKAYRLTPIVMFVHPLYAAEGHQGLYAAPGDDDDDDDDDDALTATDSATSG